jgi:Asp-tRNA(Asn)/Glu-tRNA(Gln) amidotransferase A subunit family amidase
MREKFRHFDLRREEVDPMSDLNRLTATEALRKLQAGSIKAEDLVAACVERIRERDPQVQAWVHLEPATAALARARAIDQSTPRRRLAGLPIAVKDVIDTGDMPTQYNSPIYRGYRPRVDAACVANARREDAIVLGKTVTTEFAFQHPGKTRNPWNAEHTPGGSSSGSAAAVAARMAALALGSQTVGSTLRPAAYCGVVGFKPTHGRISAVGVVPLSWSNDHVGIFGRAVEDAALALQILASPDRADPYAASAAVDDYLSSLGGLAALGGSPAPRIGVLRTLVERAQPETASHLDEVARRLAAAGAQVGDVVLPPSFAGIHDSGQVVVRSEAAAYHAPNFPRLADEYPPKIREALHHGREIRATELLAAQAHRRRFREDMAPLTLRHDALLTPTAPGPAPHGLESTGDPYFCAPWSHAGLPAIALPSGMAREGLPLSVQLVGGAFAEARLLAAAAWVEGVLGFKEAPGV